MKLRNYFTIGFLLFLLSFVSYAGNYSFLNYSAGARFSGQDNNLMLANAEKALNNNPDGKKSTWRNPATGSWGYAIPSATTRKNGLTCRTLKLLNSAGTVTDRTSYRLCRYPGGWKGV